MTFAEPAMLLALPLALAPLVLYLLRRLWNVDVAWGADYLLARALARHGGRIQWLRWLLVALRMAVLALLVVLFAGPRPAAAPATATGVHRVVVIDTSYSMQATTARVGEEPVTRWESIRRTLTGLIDAWDDADTCSLYALDRQPRWLMRAHPVADRAAIRAALDDLRVGNHRARIAEGLAAAAEAGGDGAALYLFADAQALSWEGVAVDSALPPGMPGYWIEAPIADRHNLAVTRVELSHERVLRGHPCSVFVAVRNFGDRPARHVEVGILADGTFAARETVTLIPGQEAWVHGEVTFAEAGSHRVTARLPRDVLLADDSMAAGIDVMPRLRVAVLRDPEVEPLTSSWSWLADAAAVAGDNAARGPLELALVTDARIGPALAAADVAVVDAGRTLDAPTVAALRRFVRDGGGVVLAAGARVDRSAWNELLGESDLLPATLAGLQVRPFDGDAFRTLRRPGIDDHGLRAFAKMDDGDLAAARFYAWHEIGERAVDTAVMARYDDGAPFALLRRYPMGRTLLLTAGLDGNGNNLVVREFLFPLLAELFSEAASGAIHPRTVRTGEPVRARIGNPRRIESVAFVEEGSEPRPLRVLRRAGRDEVVDAEGARMPGVCSLLLRTDTGQRRVWFGAQGERVDSDLTPLRAERRNAIEQTVGLRRVASAAELERIDGRGPERDHIALVALLVALLCLAELALGRVFA